MGKNMWCWDCGETVYKAESLKGLIHKVLNQEFYDGNDWDCEGVLINESGNSFSIAFTEGHGDAFDYLIDATPEAVACCLKEVVGLSKKLKKYYQDIEDQLYEMERTAHESQEKQTSSAR